MAIEAAPGTHWGVSPIVFEFIPTQNVLLMRPMNFSPAHFKLCAPGQRQTIGRLSPS